MTIFDNLLQTRVTLEINLASIWLCCKKEKKSQRPFCVLWDFPSLQIESFLSFFLLNLPQWKEDNPYRLFIIAKRIRDRFKVSPIKPKFDDQFFVDLLTCFVKFANMKLFLFWQNNFRFTSCTKQVNQQTIGCQIDIPNWRN